MSYSYTTSTTFTVTHARHIAAKIATDLKRLQRLYGGVSDSRIAEFEAEAIALMCAGYLKEVAYGFRRNGKWVEPTLIYTAADLAGGGIDDDPGRVSVGANIAGATFYSFLTYSDNWFQLSQTERDAIEKGLPLSRSNGEKPQVDGYLSQDKSYSAGGLSLNRSIVKGY